MKDYAGVQENPRKVGVPEGTLGSDKYPRWTGSATMGPRLKTHWLSIWYNGSDGYKLSIRAAGERSGSMSVRLGVDGRGTMRAYGWVWDVALDADRHVVAFDKREPLE